MLRSFDIAVLLKLTLPGAAESSFQKLASDLHVASSEVHGAVKRYPSEQPTSGDFCWGEVR